MARYLTATRIKASIQDLEDTRAKSSLMVEHGTELTPQGSDASVLL